MPEREVKRIPKGELEKRREEERRAEIQLLRIYINRYPDKAKEFIEQSKRNLIDNQPCLS